MRREQFLRCYSATPTSKAKAIVPKFCLRRWLIVAISVLTAHFVLQRKGRPKATGFCCELICWRKQLPIGWIITGLDVSYKHNKWWDMPLIIWAESNGLSLCCKISILLQIPRICEKIFATSIKDKIRKHHLKVTV